MTQLLIIYYQTAFFLLLCKLTNISELTTMYISVKLSLLSIVLGNKVSIYRQAEAKDGKDYNGLCALLVPLDYLLCSHVVDFIFSLLLILTQRFRLHFKRYYKYNQPKIKQRIVQPHLHTVSSKKIFKNHPIQMMRLAIDNIDQRMNIQSIYLSIRALQYIHKMSDKSINQQLNTLFSEVTHPNLQVRGARNYLKIGRQTSVVHCYIDCYQVKGDVQHILVSIVQNLDNTCKVYKNLLNFQYTSRVSTNGLETIRINFVPNQNIEQIAIINFCYNYKNGKQINKHVVLSIDFGSVQEGKQLILEELSINKKILQARWHPSKENLIIALSEDSFQILRYNEQIERIKAIRLRDIQNKEETVKLKQIEKSLKIVDFAFWHNSYQSQSQTIVAITQDGTLFLFSIFSSPDQEQDYTQEYKIVVSEILRRPSQATVKNIEVYSPKKGALLIFKKAISGIPQGQLSIINISALIELQDSCIQQPLASIRNDPNDGNLQIPYNKLYESHFYFWHKNRIARVNLKPYINYLHEVLQNHSKDIKIPKKLKTDIIVEVKEKQMKFVAVDSSAVRVLRKAETSQTYLFSTLAIETSDLLAEQNSTVKKLKSIFADLQTTMTNIVQRKSLSLASTLTSTLASLKQNADEKDVGEVAQKFQVYSTQVSKKLQKEQKELSELFGQVERLSKQFSDNRTKWRQLEQLLSRIEKNSQIISDLEIQQKGQSYESRTLDYLKKNCESLSVLELNPNLRQQYLQSFKQQQNTIWQITQALEQNQIMLQTLGSGNSISGSKIFKFQ